MKATLLIFILFLRFTAFINAQWNLQSGNTTKNLNSVYFINNDIGFTVGQGNVLKTVDGGVNWQSQSISSSTLYSVFFTDINTGYIVGDSGTILKTTDSGNIWLSQNSGTQNALYSISFPSSDTGYIAGKYGIILKTTDGGNSWNNISAIDSTIYYVNQVFFVTNEIGYLLYNSTTLIKTIDGGVTWNQTSNPGNYSPSSVYFLNQDIGYIAGQYYRSIYKTTDGGNTWNMQVDFASLTGLSSIFFIDSQNGYAVGGVGGEPLFIPDCVILKTTDGGITWVEQDVPIHYNNLHSVHFTDTDYGFAVGANGIILKTTNGGVTWINDKINEPNNITISPNPTTTNLSITLPPEFLSSTQNTLTVFDIFGKQLINHQVNSEKTQVNTSYLPRGVYIIRISNEKVSYEKRFAKM